MVYIELNRKTAGFVIEKVRQGQEFFLKKHLSDTKKRSYKLRPQKDAFAKMLPDGLITKAGIAESKLDES